MYIKNQLLVSVNSSGLFAQLHRLKFSHNPHRTTKYASDSDSNFIRDLGQKSSESGGRKYVNVDSLLNLQ